MPACPDCGLVFDSLYNVQLHRRSGACTPELAASRLAKPASAPSITAMYGGAAGAGGYHTPYGDPLYSAGVGGGHAGRGYELMAAPPLAAANNPYTSPSERELEQFLAYQRSRQAADMAERERAMLDQQVNLVLPARQAELHQSQQMLKSQLLQMKLQLYANQQHQEQGANMDMAYLRNEMAAMRGALTSLSPRQPNDGDRRHGRRHQQRKPQRRALTARSLANRRAQGAMDAMTPPPQRPDSYGGEGHRAYTSRRNNYQDDYAYGGDDGSWSSLDDELRSDDSGDVSPRGRRGGGGRNESPFPSSPSQQIRGMLQDVQNELRSLRAMSTSSRQGMDAPFPTMSTLDPGLHLLKLASLEGVDLSIPLDEIDVAVKVYYMSFAKDEYLLQPSVERNYPRRPASLVRHNAKTLLFTVAPIEFIVHHPKEMVVFVLQALYRGRLLCWSTIFSKSRGTFTEGLRNSTFDLAKALQSPENMMPGATVSGYIEVDTADSLRRAESFLNQSISSSAAMGYGPVPPLPGLPPLPPPPQGLPLLPGMPGCEGPLLPPSAETAAMVMQPGRGPAARFVLPPPTGVSILEWQESLEAHLPKVQKRSPAAAGNGAAAVKANKSKKASPKEVPLKSSPRPPPSRPVKQLQQQQQQQRPQRKPAPSPSNSSSEAEESATDEDAEESSNSDSDVSDTNPTEYVEDEATTAPEPARKQPTARFADQIVAATPPPPPPPLATTIAEPPRVPVSPVFVKDAESPRSPPKQAHTPPPKRNSNSSAGSPHGSPPPKDKSPVASPKDSLTAADAAQPAGSPHSNDILSMSLSNSQTSGKVPKDDMPLVERLRLRPIVDAQGNLAVPPGYKMNAANPPSVNLDKFDAPAEPAVNPCVLLGLAQPTDKPPATPKVPGHGTKEATVDVFLDGLTGLPLDAVCTRMLVYVTDEMDPTTGQPINPLHHPRVFMRKPDLVVYQNLTSSSVEPQFSGKLSAEVGDSTFAVVIVEFVSASQDATMVFGHCCLPINKRFFAGNFVCRVKLGDPRRSQERMVSDIRPAERVADEQRRATEKYDQKQLELSVDSQALHNLLPAPPRKRAECVPFGFLIWRLESSDIKAPFFEMPQQLPLSQAEMAIFEGRKKHKDRTPTTKGLSSPKKADNAFLDAAATPADALGNLVPFSEDRGAFVKVEGLRGLGDDAAMYIVVVYMPKAPQGRQVCYTMMPDWLSDVGAPTYKDAPFIFTGIKHDMTNTVMYMLLKLTNLDAKAEGPAKVEPLGWTMNKLFLEPVNTMRQGRFALPWIAGGLPPGVVNELLTQRIEPVYIRMMKAGEMKFLTPHATLLISQGDSACISSLVDETPGRAQSRQLLIPAALKKNYPMVTCEGMVGCTLRRAHEKCFGGGDPRALLQRINVAVQNYLRVTMPTFQEM